MGIIPLAKQEEALIKDCMKQQRKAQFQLYRIYAPKMLSVARMYIRDLHFAEDVMSRAFVKAFKKLKDYAFKGSFEGWLRKIVIRESIDFLRSHHQMEFTEDVNASLAETMEAEGLPDLGDWDVQQLLDLLPEGYRTVFVMYVVEGYKHKEIAAVLNISPNTSKSQFFKAKKHLKSILTKLKEHEKSRTL